MNPIRILAALTLLLASTGALADWAVCAPEGGVCKFSGRHEVSFGAGKAWNTRVYENGVACTAERFGDPAPGVKKSCQIRVSGGTKPAAAQWTPCAREDSLQGRPPRRSLSRAVPPLRFSRAAREKRTPRRSRPEPGGYRRGSRRAWRPSPAAACPARCRRRDWAR